jgi:hypothetical protein
MNRYFVVWTSDSEDDLASVWLVIANRTALTLATELADRLLAIDPLAYGQPIAEGMFAITIPPIRLYFDVDESASLVTITSVRQVV